MNHLQLFDKLEQEGKYTIITAPEGRGKTWEIASLYLKKLALAQAPPTEQEEEKTNASQLPLFGA